VIVSEQMLNSVLFAAHHSKKLEITHKFSSTIMKTFFPNFEEVYGHHYNLKLVLKSETAPVISIKEGISTVNFKGRLNFLNPYNEKYEAVEVAVNATASVEFELLDNFKIVGRIVDLEMKVVDYKIYFESKVTKEQLDVKMVALGKPIATTANT